MLSALQTIIIMANQNRIINIALIMGVIILAVTFMIRMATPSSTGDSSRDDV